MLRNLRAVAPMRQVTSIGVVPTTQMLRPPTPILRVKPTSGTCRSPVTPMRPTFGPRVPGNANPIVVFPRMPGSSVAPPIAQPGQQNLGEPMKDQLTAGKSPHFQRGGQMGKKKFSAFIRRKHRNKLEMHTQSKWGLRRSSRMMKSG
jgi:hypothetical protein